MSNSGAADNHPSPEDLALTVGEVAFSSYSPAALAHLPQPTPRDLPPHLDAAGVFTFQDALEDLLVVSQGRSLPDITTRYHQSTMLRQMYPHGEPAWLWLRRLRSQGLIREPRGSDIVRASQPAWEELQRGLEETAGEFWRGIREDPRNREAVAEAGRVFEELRRQFSGLNGDSRSSAESIDEKKKNDGPDNFDELFAAVKSTFANGQSAWDAFKKTINEDGPRHAEEFDRRMQKSFGDGKSADAVSPAEKSTMNGNEKETRSEWVDVFGYKHTTIKRITYDEHGKEIGSNTSITIKPAEKNDGNAIENDGGSSDKDDKKKTGWFR